SDHRVGAADEADGSAEHVAGSAEAAPPQSLADHGGEAGNPGVRPERSTEECWDTKRFKKSRCHRRGEHSIGLAAADQCDGASAVRGEVGEAAILIAPILEIEPGQ